MALWEYNHIPENVLNELISKVYTDLNKAISSQGNNYLSKRAILAITNTDVALINNKIMMRMPGDLTTY